jgi:hypothetical protein
LLGALRLSSLLLLFVRLVIGTWWRAGKAGWLTGSFARAVRELWGEYESGRKEITVVRRVSRKREVGVGERELQAMDVAM